MDTSSDVGDRPTAPTVERCRYRQRVRPRGGEELAECELLQQVLATVPGESCQVVRSVCEACCRSFPPSPAVLNPVVASLAYSRLQSLTDGGAPDLIRTRLLQVEQFLDIDVSRPQLEHQPDLLPATAATVLRDILPVPRRRCGSSVRHWAVGVTTAPRRQATLERCLDSLALAGWPRPVLFMDGRVRIPERFGSLPVTCRDEPLGAWPHYYLSLSELLMREPLADAYLLVQDDALFFDGANVREYLEETLWLGSTPGIVSLYCATSESRPHFGWTQTAGRWNCGAVALVIPRQIAVDIVLDHDVLAHRWSDDREGLAGIPDVIEGWAARRSVSLHFPMPTLVQHIGAASAIWPGSYALTPARHSGCFAGDFIRDPADGREHSPASRQVPGDPQSDPRVFRINRAAAVFPEDDYPCPGAVASEYNARVQRGRDRMRTVSAVICALCRDVVHCLPATAARIERLAGMFGSCPVVIFENDSQDSTLAWLQQWAAVNANVHVVSERRGAPALSQGIGCERTAHMAYCRNRSREAVLSMFGDYDYVIVLDADLEGGWSYDGIAHTFGDAAWDFVGSYGIWYEPDGSGNKLVPNHYDAFAFRRVGRDGLENFRAVNSMAFRRGDPFLRVWSCFGGLGVYRMECFKSARYEGRDCEHVTFHHALRALGFDRLFLNPSQIVLYSRREPPSNPRNSVKPALPDVKQAIPESGRKFRIAILQSCDEGHARMLDATTECNAAYARRQGYAYRRVVANLSRVPNTGNFNRYYLLRQEIDSGVHDWALWMDADAIVMDHGTALESIIDRTPDKLLIACRGSLEGEHDINNGVFFLNLRHPLAGDMVDAAIRHCEGLGRGNSSFQDDQHVIHRWLFGRRDAGGQIAESQCYTDREYNLFNYDGCFIRHVLREYGAFDERVAELHRLAGEARHRAASSNEVVCEPDQSSIMSGPNRLKQLAESQKLFQKEHRILVASPAAYDQPPPSSWWLVESCRRYGIELTLLGQGQPYPNHRRKIGLVAEYLHDHPKFRHVLMVDFKDVIFCATLEEVFHKYLSFGHDIVISAQRNNWPLPTLGQCSPETGRSNRYINSGSIISTAKAWIEAWDWMQDRERRLAGRPPETVDGRHIFNDDQAAWVDLYVNGGADLVVDADCQLFQVLDQVDWTVGTANRDLLLEGRRVVNRETGGRPCLIHGAGDVPLRPWAQYILDPPSTRSPPI